MTNWSLNKHIYCFLYVAGDTNILYKHTTTTKTNFQRVSKDHFVVIQQTSGLENSNCVNVTENAKMCHFAWSYKSKDQL